MYGLKRYVDPICEFNRYVDCEYHTHCDTCGWNPAVEEKRKKEIAERLSKARSLLRWIVGYER